MNFAAGGLTTLKLAHLIPFAKVGNLNLKLKLLFDESMVAATLKEKIMVLNLSYFFTKEPTT